MYFIIIVAVTLEYRKQFALFRGNNETQNISGKPRRSIALNDNTTTVLLSAKRGAILLLLPSLGRVLRTYNGVLGFGGAQCKYQSPG